MSNIRRNEPCPDCRKNGHDKSGDHLMRFEDGGGYCQRSHFHDSGKPYYEEAGDGIPLSDLPISGDIAYSVGEFRELEGTNKLVDPKLRAIALGGMKNKDRYEVMNEEELAKQHEEWKRECDWFDQLKIKHIESRGIHGLVAKMYNVRAGHDGEGKINRSYFPRYEEDELVGAKCRTFPKEFTAGNLGKLFGKQDLFGLNTFKEVSESGQYKNFVIAVGGEYDAMAVQQMFIKEVNKMDSIAERGTLDGLKKVYVISVNKGENGLQELIDNKDYLNQFKSIIWCFDNDEKGEALNLSASRLFRGKSKRLVMPNGCKDPNDCLDQGRDKEFVSAIFAAEEQQAQGKIKRVSDVITSARKIAEMGQKYWLDGLNLITYGIRTHYLSVWGAGTGVGKTDTTVQHVNNLMKLGHSVVCVYLENQVDEVARTFAGMMVGKDFNSPPQEDWELEMGFDENPARQYTQEDLDDALEKLANQDNLLIADLNGSKDVDAVMEVLEECFALGYQYFVVDNLTAFEHKNDKGVRAKGHEAIDETMKRLGTFKDEHPVNIMLLSHLVKTDSSRIPHAMGGEVYEGDFRGAGSITFWANAVWGIERHTSASTLINKCHTLYRNIKNRGVGHMVGSTVVSKKDIHTGGYSELKGVHELPEVGKPKEEKGSSGGFDYGERKDRSAPEETSEPKKLPTPDLDGSQEF